MLHVSHGKLENHGKCSNYLQNNALAVNAVVPGKNGESERAGNHMITSRGIEFLPVSQDSQVVF